MDLNALASGYRLMWYEIDSVLGHGGFGITYLATDTNLEQQVAIKEYFPSNIAIRTDGNRVAPSSAKKAETYSWGLSRFLAEAQTLAKFRHSGIVQVFSVFEANGSAYMVMEIVRGESLGDRLKSRAVVDEAAILRILYPLLDGLQLIHDAGFIHRDIKPDNIFLREDGSPVLLDFGSARLAIGSLTQTLTMLVSPGYAPFEQYSSSQSGSGRQGPWTDLYSLGATLYMAISGRGPVDSIARATATIAGHADPMLPAVEVGKGRFSEPFLAAIDKALAVQPHERPQSIEEWKQWLPLPEGFPPTTQTSGAARAPAATSIWTQPPPPTASKPPTADPGPTAILPPPAAKPARGFGPAAIASSLAIAAAVGAGIYFWLDRSGTGTPQAEPPVAMQTPPAPPPATPAGDDKASPPAAPEPSPAQRVETLLARADEALTAGRLSLPSGRNALEYFRQVQQIDPGSEAAATGVRRVMMGHLAFALHALKQNDFTEARQHLRVAESIDADAQQVVSARKQLDTAELVANQKLAAERARADRIRQLLSQAEAAQAAGRIAPPTTDNAADALRAVLELEPGNADARQGLQRIAHDLLTKAREATSAGRFAQARNQLQAAAEIDPATPGLDTSRAQLAQAEQAEQQRLAEERARQARIDELLASAKAALRAGRLGPPVRDNAVERYRAVLALDGANAAAREGLGTIIARHLQAAEKAIAAGEFARARDRIDAAGQIDGEADGIEDALARLADAERSAAEEARQARIAALLGGAAKALEAGRLSPPTADNALDGFRAALELDPDNEAARHGVERVLQAHLRLALQAGDSEDFARAREQLEAAAQIDGDAPEVSVARARIAGAARARDERVAAERARAARIERLLKDASAALADGRLVAPQGDNALEGYRAALALEAADADARAGLERVAAALLARGREAVSSEQLERARSDFDVVESIDPATAGLAAARTRLAAAEGAAEQRRAAELARAKRVEQLLLAASRALAAGRLSAPDDDNAADRYREVLSLDADNAAARKGIVEILESHLARGRAAIAAGELERAEADFDAVARIDRNAGGLADARRRLEEARQRQALQQAEAERQRVREEQARQAAERERRQAEREQAERDRAEAERQQAEAERARRETERQQAEAARRRAEAERARIEAERQQAQQAEQARLAAERDRAEQQRAAQRLTRIGELLEAGGRALAATRLTTPAGNNALEAYRAVLELDPGNRDARRGIDDIVDRYRALAEAALARDQLSRAQAYVDRAGEVDPRSPRLPGMRESIADYRAGQQAREAETRQQATEVQRLLAAADAALAAGRLDAPPGANAAEHFRAALALAPENADARRGLTAVAERLVAQARRAIAREQWATAQGHLRSASAIQPALRAIAAVRQELSEARARAERALAERTRPAPSPPPKPAPPPVAKRPPDILGKWCGGSLSIEFTADRWIFSLPDGHRTSYRIRGYSAADSGLAIRWIDERRRRMVTEFGRFTSDGQSMTQLRGKQEDEEGWHQYNRRFTRC
ncbi:MAG: protein kinase [Rhodocyclaceae bacterium]|nr:protein kinase [Rhodocyclaceae bacterium]